MRVEGSAMVGRVGKTRRGEARFVALFMYFAYKWKKLRDRVS